MRHSPAGGLATLHPRQVAGLWGSEHRSAHINILEMLAVSNALQHFRSDILGRAVLVRCDNATVVAYINHQGGTRSGRLCALAWDLIHWCIRHGVTLSAVHLPGEENVTADALSRGWIIPTEWSLLPQVARSLFLLIDGPHVDLFTSRANNQLPIYCARRPDPSAWQIDTLAFQWDGLLAYAFPPFPLIPRVLAKIEQENSRVLLIAPWFPRLINLLVHCPILWGLANGVLSLHGWTNIIVFLLRISINILRLRQCLTRRRINSPRRESTEFCYVV